MMERLDSGRIVVPFRDTRFSRLNPSLKAFRQGLKNSSVTDEALLRMFAKIFSRTSKYSAQAVWQLFETVEDFRPNLKKMIRFHFGPLREPHVVH